MNETPDFILPARSEAEGAESAQSRANAEARMLAMKRLQEIRSWVTPEEAQRAIQEIEDLRESEGYIE